MVDNDEKLAERIGFIHERIGTAAIVEQYIEGREIYVGVLGNDRLRVLPVWELQFRICRDRDWPIATEKVKHDPDYQERHSILHGPAKNLAPEVLARIQRFAKRIYRALELDGYARIDFRLAADGTPYFWRPIPTRRSQRARSSPRRRSMTGSNIAICCIAFVALGMKRAVTAVSGG